MESQNARSHHGHDYGEADHHRDPAGARARPALRCRRPARLGSVGNPLIILRPREIPYLSCVGGVAERFNAPVLKTGGLRSTWVRIPPPPFSSVASTLMVGATVVYPGLRVGWDSSSRVFGYAESARGGGLRPAAQKLVGEDRPGAPWIDVPRTAPLACVRGRDHPHPLLPMSPSPVATPGDTAPRERPIRGGRSWDASGSRSSVPPPGPWGLGGGGPGLSLRRAGRGRSTGSSGPNREPRPPRQAPGPPHIRSLRGVRASGPHRRLPVRHGGQRGLGGSRVRRRGRAGPHRVSVARIFQLDNRGLPGYRAVLFGRAAVDHPAGPPPARPIASGGADFRVSEPLSIQNDYFEAAFLRPTRSPGCASTAPSRARLQTWLPACWLRFGWVGIAPTGRLIRVSVCHPQTSSPTGIAWSLPETS